MKFKNMKIAINEQQPLGEVMETLKEKGYTQWDDANRPKFIITHESGLYQMIWNDVQRLKDWTLTTLAELKEM